MKDIAICTLQECIRSNECYRFSEKVEKLQTYLAEPQKDCVEEDYKLFYKK